MQVGVVFCAVRQTRDGLLLKQARQLRGDVRGYFPYLFRNDALVDCGQVLNPPGDGDRFHLQFERIIEVGQDDAVAFHRARPGRRLFDGPSVGRRDKERRKRQSTPLSQGLKPRQRQDCSNSTRTVRRSSGTSIAARSNAPFRAIDSAGIGTQIS